MSTESNNDRHEKAKAVIAALENDIQVLDKLIRSYDEEEQAIAKIDAEERYIRSLYSNGSPRALEKISAFFRKLLLP